MSCHVRCGLSHKMPQRSVSPSKIDFGLSSPLLTLLLCIWLPGTSTTVKTEFKIWAQESDQRYSAGVVDILNGAAGQRLVPPVHFRSASEGEEYTQADFAVLSSLELSCVSLAEGWSPLATRFWIGDGVSTNGEGTVLISGSSSTRDSVGRSVCVPAAWSLPTIVGIQSFPTLREASSVSVCGNRSLSLLQDGSVELALVASTELQEEGGGFNAERVLSRLASLWQAEPYPLPTSAAVFPQWGLAAAPGVPASVRMAVLAALAGGEERWGVAVWGGGATELLAGARVLVSGTERGFAECRRPETLRELLEGERRGESSRRGRMGGGLEAAHAQGEDGLRGRWTERAGRRAGAECAAPVGVEETVCAPWSSGSVRVVVRAGDTEDYDECERWRVCASARATAVLRLLLMHDQRRISGSVTCLGQQSGSTVQSSCTEAEEEEDGGWDLAVSAARAGPVVVEVLLDGEPVGNSPFLVMVVAPKCPTDKVLSWSDAECVCDRALSVGSACVRLSTILLAVFLPIAVALALLLGYQVTRSSPPGSDDSLWTIPYDELTFESRRLLGSGTYGTVEAAEYRGTTVAVKRVMFPRLRAEAEEDDTFSTRSRSTPKAKRVASDPASPSQSRPPQPTWTTLRRVSSVGSISSSSPLPAAVKPLAGISPHIVPAVPADAELEGGPRQQRVRRASCSASAMPPMVLEGDEDSGQAARGARSDGRRQSNGDDWRGAGVGVDVDLGLQADGVWGDGAGGLGAMPLEAPQSLSIGDKGEGLPGQSTVTRRPAPPVSVTTSEVVTEGKRLSLSADVGFMSHTDRGAGVFEAASPMPSSTASLAPHHEPPPHVAASRRRPSNDGTGMSESCHADTQIEMGEASVPKLSPLLPRMSPTSSWRKRVVNRPVTITTSVLGPDDTGHGSNYSFEEVSLSQEGSFRAKGQRAFRAVFGQVWGGGSPGVGRDGSVSSESGRVRKQASSMLRRKKGKPVDQEEQLTWMRREVLVEMRTVAALRHPALTTVMGSSLDDDGLPLIVMEYMPHGSMYDFLHNQTVPSNSAWGMVLPILDDVVSGMSFLHSCTPPVIHGDLKSTNVLLDSSFRAKLVDYGLTQKWRYGLKSSSRSRMSPELLQGGKLTTSADCYAFGMLLFEAMTCTEPFEDEDDVEGVLRAVCDVERDPPMRPDIPEDVHEGVQQLICRCWDNDADLRPGFEEISEVLTNIEGTDSTQRPTAMEALVTAQRTSSSPSRHSDDRTPSLERSGSMNQATKLLNAVFPRHIASALLEGRKVEQESREVVTIFFSDIVGFTAVSSQLDAHGVARMLDRLYTKFDQLSDMHQVFKVETIGDAYMAVTNLVQDQTRDHAARMARFALQALEAANQTLIDDKEPSKGTVKIRVGLHSGPVVADVVGVRNPRYCLFGDSVATAQKMEQNSQERRILCTPECAGHLRAQAPGVLLEARGETEIKGLGAVHTFWVEGEIRPQEEERAGGRGSERNLNKSRSMPHAARKHSVAKVSSLFARRRFTVTGSAARTSSFFGSRSPPRGMVSPTGSSNTLPSPTTSFFARRSDTMRRSPGPGADGPPRTEQRSLTPKSKSMRYVPSMGKGGGLASFSRKASGRDKMDRTTSL